MGSSDKKPRQRTDCSVRCLGFWRITMKKRLKVFRKTTFKRLFLYVECELVLVILCAAGEVDAFYLIVACESCDKVVTR